MKKMVTEILDFWFQNKENWFEKSEAFDQKITEKFLEIYTDFTTFEENLWTESPKEILGSILVLDQFSRNMFRDSPRAFQFDFMALFLAKLALEKFSLEAFSDDEKPFILLPLMHSESLPDQELCVKYFEILAKSNPAFEQNKKFALEHKNIIFIFGRFPHRNAVLGRDSTEEENFFLRLHSGF